VRSIKVTYRAVFEQPIGILNPMGCRLPGPQPVELVKKGPHWVAREIATARRQVYEKFARFFSLQGAQNEVTRHFERCLVPWQIWGIPPITATENRDHVAQERILVPGVDICDLGDGEWGWFTPEDRTHICRPGAPTGQGKAQAACTAVVPTKIIISTRAHVEPTCPQCAEIYLKEFQHA